MEVTTRTTASGGTRVRWESEDATNRISVDEYSRDNGEPWFTTVTVQPKFGVTERRIDLGKPGVYTGNSPLKVGDLQVWLTPAEIRELRAVIAELNVQEKRNA